MKGGVRSDETPADEEDLQKQQQQPQQQQQQQQQPKAPRTSKSKAGQKSKVKHQKKEGEEKNIIMKKDTVIEKKPEPLAAEKKKEPTTDKTTDMVKTSEREQKEEAKQTTTKPPSDIQKKESNLEGNSIIPTQPSTDKIPPGGRSSQLMKRYEGSEGVDREEEKMLRRVPGFHGYLPREDVDLIVKNVGDYLIRISEVEEEGGKKLKEIVLSVRGEQMKEGEKTNVVRNMVVSKKEGKYFLNMKQQHNSLQELIDFHKQNPWKNKSAKVSFQLLAPIALQKWEYTHYDVKIGKKLGVGAFGEVCGGKLRTKKGASIDVAIKVAKGMEEVSKEKMRELVNEARLVRNFKHKNVVRTYGVAVDKQPLYIILELVSGGSLNNYLRNHVGQTTDSDRLTMCLGAAKGLLYLHQHNCVHADVAARNCLISTEKIVKISDFGLSFELHPDETTRATGQSKLPIKWLAPETISQRIFSQKTDIYTFGVLCFEVFSDGGEPYNTVSNKEAKIMARQWKWLGMGEIQIPKGEILEMPKACPEMLRGFLKERVFAMDPVTRPIMAEIVFALQKNGAIDIELPLK